MSVEQTRGRLDCGLEGIVEDVSDERFRGIRIFDVGDLTRPVQVGAVQTCRGSHTHSVVVTADDERIIVYNSGTSSRIREEDELEGCIDESPGDYRTALFRIDVIEIPVDDPASARIVDSPAVFADPEDGTLAGLWRRRRPRRRTRRSPAAPTSATTLRCSRNSAWPPAPARATASCSISPIPLNPQRIDAVVDRASPTGIRRPSTTTAPRSCSPTNGAAAACRAAVPSTRWTGARTPSTTSSTGVLEFRSYFKMPAPQTEQENCVAHNGSVVPGPGPRHLRSGLVPGRHLRARLHRFEPTRWRSRTSTAVPSMKNT